LHLVGYMQYTKNVQQTDMGESTMFNSRHHMTAWIKNTVLHKFHLGQRS